LDIANHAQAWYNMHTDHPHPTPDDVCAVAVL